MASECVHCSHSTATKDDVPTREIRGLSQSHGSMPPPLDYSVADHRTGLIISVLLIVFLNTCAPVLIFYLVKHYTDVQRETLYGVTTAALATPPLMWPIRAWKLLRKGGQRSPLPEDGTGAANIQCKGAKWWQRFDIFQWQVSHGI